MSVLKEFFFRKKDVEDSFGKKGAKTFRTLEKIENLETVKINPFFNFIKIKTTVRYFILPSTNTTLPKIQNRKRNVLTLRYKKSYKKVEHPP